MTERRAAPDTLPPLQEAEAALHRAALRARERARQTGTPLVISENGKVIRLRVDASGKVKRGTRRSRRG